MLLPPKVAHGVADGSVTLAFRRWRKQDVQVGSEFRTVAGVIRVDAVEVVDEITETEAQQAGWPDVARLQKQLDKVEGDWPTYRVRLSWAGPDPRVALLTHSPLLTLSRSRLQLEWRRSGSWSLDGTVSCGLPHLTPD